MSPTRASPAPLCGVGDADDTGLAKAWAQRRWLQSGLLAGALLLISAALILTLTRSALIAVLLAVPVVLIARWPRARVDNFARIALSATTCLGLLLLAASFVSPLMQLRLFSVNDRNWYRAAYAVPPLPPLKAGETLTLSIVLHNVGQRVWESDGPHATFVLYHWLSADGKQMIVANGLHSPLPRSVKPGETIELKAHVRAPDRAGEYVLAWDMLRDGLFWFSVLGAPMHELRAQVLPGEFNPPAPPQVNAPNSMAALNADRATLWSAALKMLAAHPWLGVGPGNFRLQFGPYLNTAEWDNRLHANNTYLELFADAGLLGGLAFLFFVLMIVRSGWRVLQVRDDAYGAALVGALAAFFIHAATDYFLEFTPTYLLFWLTLGLLLAHHRQTCEVYAVSDS